jgi:hypothetical protein
MAFAVVLSFALFAAAGSSIGSAQGCLFRKHLTLAIYTSFDMNNLRNNGCWTFDRPVNGPPQSPCKSDGRWSNHWAYDDTAFSQDDVGAIEDCARHHAGAAGLVFMAFRLQRSPSWYRAPARTNIAAYFAELYVEPAREFVNSTALSRWSPRIGAPMISVGAVAQGPPAADARRVQQLVHQMCRASDVVGVYAGSRIPTIVVSSARRAAIVQAMNDCTMGR